MNKKTRLLISFVILFGCITAITYSNKLKREENTRKSYREVNTTIQENKNIGNTDIYNDFLMNINTQGEEYYYSFIELSGYDYPILLLSDDVYKDKNEGEVALCTDIYYPVNKEVILFGNICSNGTAYPISANTSGIYTAGGHEVEKFSLDIQSQRLKSINTYIMYFHKTGEEVKTIIIGIIGDENKIVSEEEFDKAYNEYVNARRVYFKPLV